MLGFIMYVAPLGAFGAMAFTVGTFGLPDWVKSANPSAPIPREFPVVSDTHPVDASPLPPTRTFPLMSVPPMLDPITVTDAAPVVPMFVRTMLLGAMLAPP